MKKYLAILGLALALSQPVFAQCGTCNPCNTCLPRVQVVTAPICVEPCAPICNPCMTGAACPVVVSNPCCDPCCNPCMQCCPEKKGFWKRFLGY